MVSPSSNVAVVLLHGQPGAGVEWHRVVDRLGDGVDVLAPDRPGYGRNLLPAGGVATNVDWLVQLIEERTGGSGAVVAGLSWAGSVAMGVALHRPDLVRALVLVSSVGPGRVTSIDRLLARPVIGAAVVRPAFGVARPLLRRALARTERDAAARDAMFEAIDVSRSRDIWRTFLTEQRAVFADMPHLFAGLDQITVPTKIVAGTRDRVIPFATATALATRVPDAALVRVDGGGHALHRTHPDDVAAVIREAAAVSMVS